MSGTEQFDREKMINAIWAAKGKVSLAAQTMGCTVRTLYGYAAKYATVQQAIDDARAAWDEQLLDLAEIKLYDEVKVGKAWAIRYALSTKGKERGYIERQEFTGKNGSPLVQFVWDDDGDNSGHSTD